MNFGIAIYVIFCCLTMIWLLRLWFEVRFSERSTDSDYYIDVSARSDKVFSRQTTTSTEVITIITIITHKYPKNFALCISEPYPIEMWQWNFACFNFKWHWRFLQTKKSQTQFSFFFRPQNILAFFRYFFSHYLFFSFVNTICSLAGLHMQSFICISRGSGDTASIKSILLVLKTLYLQTSV